MKSPNKLLVSLLMGIFTVGSFSANNSELIKAVNTLTSELVSGRLHASEGTMDELDELIEEVLRNYAHMNDLIDHIRGHIARLDAEGEKGIAHEIDDFCKGEIDFISDEIGTFTKEMEAEQTSISTKIEQAKEQLIQSCGSIRSLSEFNLEVTRYMTGKDDQQGNYAEQQEKVHRKKQELLEEQRATLEAAHKARGVQEKQEAARKAREAEERRKREEAERMECEAEEAARKGAERRAREAEEARKREQAERIEREAEARRQREAQEAARKAREVKERKAREAEEAARKEAERRAREAAEARKHREEQEAARKAREAEARKAREEAEQIEREAEEATRVREREQEEAVSMAFIQQLQQEEEEERQKQEEAHEAAARRLAEESGWI